MRNIPESTKPYIGLNVSNGLFAALEKAHGNMDMSRAEFVRYCLMRTLQELSLLSEQVKKGVDDES